MKYGNTTDLNLDGDLDLGHERHPFLAASDSGCFYTLELQAARKWVSKKDKLWRAAFTVLVKDAEGEGATPIGTRCTVLIQEEKKFGYHVRDLQNIGTAITGARLNEATYAQLLPEGGEPTRFKGARFLAQVVKNEKGYRKESFFRPEDAEESGQQE